MPPVIQELAPAKINLFLHVGAVRADGFHALQSLAIFANGAQASDRLDFAAAGGISLTVGGPFAAELSGESDNLILRAARALAARFGIRDEAAMTLTKVLPVASGIGGGSADGAAALRGLARLWNLDADTTRLADVAASLGSDVPVCVGARTAFMEGRGEILTPLAAMPRLPLLLVNPGVGVSTKAVFAALETRRGTEMSLPANGFADSETLLDFLTATGNDLEAPARAIQPVIGDVLDAIAVCPGVLLVRMSGSGATCFGLFENEESCAHAAETLRAAHPRWWVAESHVGN